VQKEVEGGWWLVVDGGVVGSRKESNECRTGVLMMSLFVDVDVGGES
jgi:hypothetical protein